MCIRPGGICSPSFGCLMAASMVAIMQAVNGLESSGEIILELNGARKNS